METGNQHSSSAGISGLAGLEEKAEIYTGYEKVEV
jgi:hypothetical protein